MAATSPCRFYRLSCGTPIPYFFNVRTLLIILAVILWASSPRATTAASARIAKVLPQLEDQQGRIALNPSLYERDAYQQYLRRNPEMRSAIRFAIKWKAKDTGALKLKVEMRGNRGRLGTLATVETPVKFRGFFSTWSNVSLGGTNAASFGDLSAWRATLWDGERIVAEQKSFLW